MKLKILFLIFLSSISKTFQASESSFTDNRPTNPLWKSTWTDKLKQDLLLHYDKFARPMHHGNKTSVVLEPVIRHIEMDEKRSIMTVHCWLNMYWEDEKLKWDPKNYSGLKEIHLADHEVWQPDVFPYNSATGSTIDHYGNTNLIAYFNGTIIWVPPSIFQVFCQMDFTKWPFDTQMCSLKIGSWTYNGEQVDLLNSNHMQTIYDMPQLVPNAEWNFVKMTVQRNSVQYPCCPVPYIDITFDLTIQRHSATYKALIITPASAIILMTLASFWLPPTSGDKMTLGGAAVITTCLFLLYFMQKMPALAGNTPYIITFYSKTLYLVSFAVAIEVFVLNLAKNPKLSSLPWILKKNLTGGFGRCLLINGSENQHQFSRAEELTDNQPVLPEQNRHLGETNTNANQKDWILFATVIDRISFIVYCCTFVIMAFVYLI